MMIKKAFSALDFLTPNTTWRISKLEYYKNPKGGVLFLLLIIILVAFAVWGISLIVNRSTFTLSS
jgi:hypothetical protein